MAEDIKVYTLNEIADLLHVTKRSLYSWIKSGRLKALKVGREWRVTKESLEAFMAENTNDKTEDQPAKKA